LDADENDMIDVFCSCPRFDEQEICKHLAALVVEADRKGYTQNWSVRPEMFLCPCDPLFDEDQGDVFYYDDDSELEDEEFHTPRIQSSQPSKAPEKPKEPIKPVPDWSKKLSLIERSQTQYGPIHTLPPISTKKQRRLLYVVDTRASMTANSVVVTFMHQELRKNGGFSAPKKARRSFAEFHKDYSEEDKEIFGRLAALSFKDDYYSVSISSDSKVSQCVIPSASAQEYLPRILATGRCVITPNLTTASPALVSATWDEGPLWRFELDWKKDAKRKVLIAHGRFRRPGPDGEEILPVEKTSIVFSDGLMMMPDRFSRAEPLSRQSMAWIKFFRGREELAVPEKDLSEFAGQFYATASSTELNLPEEHRWPVVETKPQPCVRITKAKSHYYNESLYAKVFYSYDGTEIGMSDVSLRFADTSTKRLIVRDLQEESVRYGQLHQAGFRNPDSYVREKCDLQLPEKKLHLAVSELMQLGWVVEAEGIGMRSPGKFDISVTSGVDWFDLSVVFDFDGMKATLPELLEAVENGNSYITLGDGTRGMLPQAWLKKYAPIVEMGKQHGDSLRFLPSQAIILDAMLAAQPEANLDATFRRVRDKLRTFEGVKASKEPTNFQGKLRDYQREGLGWLEFLREFGFGGCLADDMGLGKTIQVLALLESIRTSRAKKNTNLGPSLVVAPKSLVFNWVDEAARFTPQMKVLNYTGVERKTIGDSIAEYDLIVTTYGTLRKDVLALNKKNFHYAILDEAQAIKNPTSLSAKACRLLQAEHRLVMTGTPVENHLGDLWSLFEFLNPGMLGRSNQLAVFAGRSKPDPGSVELLAKALRPFLLRRTKEQVLKELPKKTEQTLYCEMEPKQQKLYNELRDHYRALLAKTIETKGLAKSKIHVLEALLRLRQAACHPALVDKKKASLPSAKLDALVEQLTEVIEERHKVLVFSQFTSLLALVKPRLEKLGITYEYLDGSTTNRKACVERFQTDENCRVFLISLKAGGHGLNLTAADYVFILDPWWNPAVEMQAVDRAHRIGQQRPVFAYRLIARGTVEEKILELQKQKRTLADAVITADENLLRSLTADDLQMLLS
jgi:superfamily II DNA or RNA helicase